MLCNPYLSPEQNDTVEINSRLSRECGFSALHARYLLLKAESLLELSNSCLLDGDRAEAGRFVTEAEYLQQVAFDEDPLFIFQFNPNREQTPTVRVGCFRVSRVSVRAIQGTVTQIDSELIGSNGQKKECIEGSLQKYTTFARECIHRQLQAKMLY